MTTQPPRCAVVHTPAWPLVAAVMNGAAGRGPAHDPDGALVLLRAQRVHCCSPSAWADGVRPGMRRRQAQGACPHAVLVDDDPDRDARCFEPVVRSVGTLVPLLDVESPGSLLMGTRGPSRYVGGDAALAVRLGELAHVGLAGATPIDPARLLATGGGLGVGIADGRIAATLAARAAIRRGESVVVAPGARATAAFLAPHPIAMLAAVGGCDVGLVDLLQRLGLRRFGDVAALAPHHLVDRFGAVGDTVHRLVSGTDDTPPSALPPPPDLTITRQFDDAVGQFDMLVFAAKSLVDEVSRHFVERRQLCTRLRVEAETEHGERLLRLWRHEGALTPGAIAERVRWQLEGWLTASAVRQPTGGLTRLALVPDQVVPARGRQLGFWGGQGEPARRAARAAGRVAGLIGPGAVQVVQRRGGRHPDEQFSLLAATAVDLESRAEQPLPLDAAPWPGRLPTPSPTWVWPLEDRPRARVLDGDDAVVTVSGRGELRATPCRLVVGDWPRSRVIEAWAGPWPVEERWWDGARRRRAARLQVVLDDGSAWLMVLEGGQWRAAARYD